MKTIIFDIDGTLTNMWPIEKSVLLRMTNNIFEEDIEQMKLSGVSDTYRIFLKISRRKVSKNQYTNLYNQVFSVIYSKNQLSLPEKYPLVQWIFTNRNNYRFVYITGGQQLETHYVLQCFNIKKYFDLENSISKTSCRFSKKTGIPFRKIKEKYENCLFITDSEVDRQGAALAQVPSIIVMPKQENFELITERLVKDLETT